MKGPLCWQVCVYTWCKQILHILCTASKVSAGLYEGPAAGIGYGQCIAWQEQCEKTWVDNFRMRCGLLLNNPFGTSEASHRCNQSRSL